MEVGDIGTAVMFDLPCDVLHDNKRLVSQKAFRIVVKAHDTYGFISGVCKLVARP